MHGAEPRSRARARGKQTMNRRVRGRTSESPVRIMREAFPRKFHHLQCDACGRSADYFRAVPFTMINSLPFADPLRRRRRPRLARHLAETCACPQPNARLSVVLRRHRNDLSVTLQTVLAAVIVHCTTLDGVGETAYSSKIASCNRTNTKLNV
jgi:hypothetical protein